MIAKEVILEAGVVIHHPDLVNLYGCHVGEGTRIGTFVEIQRGAAIGRFCKLSSHSLICDGVAIEDGVFVSHGVHVHQRPFSARADARRPLQTTLTGRSRARAWTQARPSAAMPRSWPA